MCAQSIHAGALITEVESETDTTSTVTGFYASITGDELYTAVQLPNFRSLVAWRTILYITQGYLSMGIRQPRERVKFGQRYFSEKVELNF